MTRSIWCSPVSFHREFRFVGTDVICVEVFEFEQVIFYLQRIHIVEDGHLQKPGSCGTHVKASSLSTSGGVTDTKS